MPIGLSDSQYLVALSILVATFASASYAALDLGGRDRTPRRHARRMRLVGAAMTMGGGIWATHFVAMLAFRAGGNRHSTMVRRWIEAGRSRP